MSRLGAVSVGTINVVSWVEVEGVVGRASLAPSDRQPLRSLSFLERIQPTLLFLLAQHTYSRLHLDHLLVPQVLVRPWLPWVRVCLRSLLGWKLAPIAPGPEGTAAFPCMDSSTDKYLFLSLHSDSGHPRSQGQSAFPSSTRSSQPSELTLPLAFLPVPHSTLLQGRRPPVPDRTLPAVDPRHGGGEHPGYAVLHVRGRQLYAHPHLKPLQCVPLPLPLARAFYLLAGLVLGGLGGKSIVHYQLASLEGQLWGVLS